MEYKSDIKKCKNVRFDEKRVSSGGWINSLQQFFKSSFLISHSVRAHGNVHIYLPYFFLRKVYKFLDIHRICEKFYTYVIVVTHGIQINHKKM